MKKLMLIAAFVVAAVTANAQYKPGTWSIQPKAGIGFSTVTGSDLSKTTVATMIGGEFEYQYNNYFGFAAGLNFSMQGCGFEKNGADTNRLDLYYINIPAVVNVYATKGLAFKAGLQLGFNVYSDHVLKQGGTTIDTDVSKNFNTVDLSIPVGVSYEFSHVVIDARYHIGLTNVEKNVSTKNSVFMVTGGYKFSL